MGPGFAIDPKMQGGCLVGYGPSLQKVDDIELIHVYKCPQCGHSDNGRH